MMFNGMALDLKYPSLLWRCTVALSEPSSGGILQVTWSLKGRASTSSLLFTTQKSTRPGLFVAMVSTDSPRGSTRSGCTDSTRRLVVMNSGT